MRELIQKIALLESTGLAGRKPGDTFKNPEGDKITFSQIQFYPNEGGKYEKEQLDKVLSTIRNVEWQNSRTSKTGGFAIATFETPEGTKQFGYYKDSIKPDPTDNYIPNQVGNYRFAGKAAEKIQSGLTPQDLLTQRDNLTSEQIIAQLSEKLGPENILVQVAQRVANGDPFPLSFPAPEGVSFTGFRDYFCEILQPMALQVGSFTGNAGEAAERFMDGSFADSLISFDSAKNAGLSDSILTKEDGKYIKISTKGGKGATASVKNLLDSLKELEQGPNGSKLIEKYKDTIELIQEISEKGQVMAPLYLGEKYGIIDSEDAATIRSLRNAGPISMKNIDKMNISDNLKKLAKERETDSPERTNLFYHLLASVAHLAAIKVNDETDFSQAASDILNNGALVQVYTKAKQTEKEWTLEQFDTVYPGQSIKGVYLSAGKNYFSTGIKGNYTFKIDRSGKKPKDEENDEVAAEPTVAKDLDKDLEKAAKSITRGHNKPIDMGAKSKKGIGREKRK